MGQTQQAPARVDVFEPIAAFGRRGHGLVGLRAVGQAVGPAHLPGYYNSGSRIFRRKGACVTRPVFPVAVILLTFPSAVCAHGLDATCSYRDGKIVVQVYYDTQEPAIDAQAVVEGSDGQTVARGRTDAAGELRFVHPGAGRYRVIIDTADSHRVVKKINLTATDFAPDEVVSDGPSRESFTGYRWLKWAVGLTAVGLFAFALRVAVRRASGGRYNEGDSSPPGGVAGPP